MRQDGINAQPGAGTKPRSCSCLKQQAELLLVTQVPFMGLVGNHEIETDAKHRDFQAYTNRFRFPFAESGSRSQLFYSFDLAGLPAGLVCAVWKLQASCQMAFEALSDAEQLHSWLVSDSTAILHGSYYACLMSQSL